MRPPRMLAPLTAALVSGTLAGCGSSAPSELPPAPAIVWPDGEPDSPLEADPAVQTVRRANLAIALAVNAHYFADPEFQDNTMTAAYRGGITGAFGGAIGAGKPYVIPGPMPFEPLDVTAPEPGIHHVTVCQITDWYDQPAWTPDPGKAPYPDAMEVTYSVRDYDGHLLLDDGIPNYSAPCDPTSIHKGYFDPAPALDPGLTSGDVNWGPDALPTMQVTDR